MPHFDLEGFIKAVCVAFGVAGVVFAETGLFFGIFLPGDSLLFTAGFLASQGHLNIALLCLVCFVWAVVGDSMGYYIGDKMGRRLFTKPESRVFKPSNLLKTQLFFDRHGGKAIILGRFMPIVRTMVPMVAGAGTMPYRRFFQLQRDRRISLGRLHSASRLLPRQHHTGRRQVPASDHPRDHRRLDRAICLPYLEGERRPDQGRSATPARRAPGLDQSDERRNHP